jgi:glycosyltransferase involved in cell wall biosynthesis
MTTEISVVIAAYNAGKYIARALTGLARQTRLPDEVIVVDDGSSDDTVIRVEEFMRESELNIRLVRQFNRGPGAARNHGLSKCKGDYVVFTDADDMVYPDFISRALFGLVQYAHWIACFCDLDVVGEEGEVLQRDLDRPLFRSIGKKSVGNNYYELDDPALFEKMITGMPIPPTIMLRRSSVTAVHGFDEDVKVGEDLMLMLKLVKLGGSFGYFADSLGIYQKHEGSLFSSSNALAHFECLDKCLSKLLEQRAYFGLSASELRMIKARKRKLAPRWIYVASSVGSRSTVPLALRLLIEGKITPVGFVKAILRYLAGFFRPAEGR